MDDGLYNRECKLAKKPSEYPKLNKRPSLPDISLLTDLQWGSLIVLVISSISKTQRIDKACKQLQVIAPVRQIRGKWTEVNIIEGSCR